MRMTRLPLPEVGALALTRAALGLGVGLLLADRISPQARKRVGMVLVAVGAATTVPLVADILAHPGSDPGAPVGATPPA